MGLFNSLLMGVFINSMALIAFTLVTTVYFFTIMRKNYVIQKKHSVYMGILQICYILITFGCGVAFIWIFTKIFYDIDQNMPEIRRFLTDQDLLLETPFAKQAFILLELQIFVQFISITFHLNLVAKRFKHLNDPKITKKVEITTFVGNIISTAMLIIVIVSIYLRIK